VNTGRNVPIDSPFWGIIGNIFAVAVQNLLPPLFPLASRWNHAMEKFIETDFGRHFQSFESFGSLQRAPAEQNAGIGLGICLLVLTSIIAVRFYRGGRESVHPIGLTSKLLIIAPWFVLLVFMAKVGVNQTARYLASYYPLLFPSLLRLQGYGVLVRQLWWQKFALGVSVVSILLLISSRQRPLFPAQTLVAALQHKWPNNSSLMSLKNSLSYHDQYSGSFETIVKQIPSTERVIGYAEKFGYNETILRKPFGSRSVLRVLSGDPLPRIRGAGIHYIVVDPTALTKPVITLDEWNKPYGGKIIMQSEIRGAPDARPETIYLIRLPEVPQGASLDKK
jgi:hypothetical protein